MLIGGQVGRVSRVVLGSFWGSFWDVLTQCLLVCWKLFSVRNEMKMFAFACCVLVKKFILLNEHFFRCFCSGYKHQVNQCLLIKAVLINLSHFGAVVCFKILLKSVNPTSLFDNLARLFTRSLCSKKMEPHWHEAPVRSTCLSCRSLRCIVTSALVITS